MKSVLLLVIISCFAKAQVILKLYKDSISTYKFSGGDEFNSANLNEKDWTNGLSWSRVHMIQDLAFSPKNVNLADGLVNFTAMKEDSTYTLLPWEVDSNFFRQKKIAMIPKTWDTHYSVGCIVSKKKYHYGYYEIRFKVEEGRGIWPAYWFYGGNKNDEIDIFELKCEKNNKIHVDTHCPYGCDRGYKNKLGFKTNWGGWLPVSKYLHEGFNVMSLEWKPNELIWYINGYPLAYFKGKFEVPMNLYVNTSVAKDGEAFPPGPNKTTKWPNTYSVDYFRAWNFAGHEEVVLKKNSGANLSNKFPSVYDTRPKKKRGINYHRKLKKEQGVISLVMSGDDLIITPLGKIRDAKNSIRLKGAKTDTAINDFSREVVTKIDPAETELEVVVTQGKKEYRKKFRISQ